MREQIKLCLDNNANLTEELRENIFELVIVFNQKFPDVRLKNLCERLKTLKVERISRFVQPGVIGYSPTTNTVTFNLNELDKEHDAKHLLMFALLQIITASGNNVGFDIDRKFEALNLGYTEILTNFLVGNESKNFYFGPQCTYANVIGIIVGSETMKEAYFFNKPSNILNALEEAGVRL